LLIVQTENKRSPHQKNRKKKKWLASKYLKITLMTYEYDILF
jgi:hypothetical protein